MTDPWQLDIDALVLAYAARTLSPVEALAALRTVYPGGVQTAGNSSALVDGAVGAVVEVISWVLGGGRLRRRGMRAVRCRRGCAR